MSKKIAGLDIGSNTILMLVVEADDQGNFKVIEDCHEIARLGENLNKTGIICDQAIERASKIMEKYRAICIKHSVDAVIAAATSAMRDASNGSKVKAILEGIIGADINIIEGDEEARLSYIGTVVDSPASLIDIGGGSTEFISGENGAINERISLNMGVIRLTEKCWKAHPPNKVEIEDARNIIREFLGGLSKDYILGKLYAVAGTPTTLAQIILELNEFDPEKVEGYELRKETLSGLVDKILSMPLEEISSKWNIHPQRADVLLAGILILEESLIYFGLDSCTVSIKGLRYGLVQNYLKNKSISL